MLATIDCFFFFQFDIFVVIGMPNDFWLKIGYFGYYVVGLWILFEPSVFTDFIDKPSAGIVPCYWQVEVEV